MEQFKVGDWIRITKGNYNWSEDMNEYIGKEFQITNVIDKKYWQIEFKGSGNWTWRLSEGHFIKVEKTYEIY